MKKIFATLTSDEILKEAYERFKAYEMDVDSEAPYDHKNFMERLKSFIHESDMFEQKRKAATPEPAPTGNGNFVLFEVMKDICARADAGQKKYGTMLRTENGRDALNDALQEAIDLVFYLKQKIMEDGK
jgi:uncharacterized membrane protein